MSTPGQTSQHPERRLDPPAVPWYKQAYRRNVVDMHINDWDEQFLSQFDPLGYARHLDQCGAQTTVLYAHSHVGLTNYPTEHGKMHSGLRGRDIYTETAQACRERGIAVQLYFSLIFDTWAYRNHEAWRMRNADGSGVADASRYGVCCPNSGYQDYVQKMIAEFSGRLPFDGVRFDMTFWPTVCYCDACRNRFADEVGGDLPVIIDWEDLRWVAFQRRREAWLTGFAEKATAEVHAQRPDASVEHQASTLIQFWRFGVTWQLAAQNTFLQGDFYGDILQGSVARKVFYNLSSELPFGFETSFCASLRNHTSRKSDDWLRCCALSALADGGAFVFIDAIDPLGTMNPSVYETMRRVFDEMQPYEVLIGGERIQDVVIYLSTESKFDPAVNGTSLAGGTEGATNQGASTSMPHVDALLGCARSLIHHHVPYGVITKRNIGELDSFPVVVLPEVLMMDEEEAAAFQSYVENGGRLYASKHTSLQRSDGVRPGGFMLEEVFGVAYDGETEETATYMAPVDGQEALLAPYTREHPFGLTTSQAQVRATPGAKPIATLTLPFSPPADWENFTSIHSDPPGKPTDRPAIVLHPYGKGKAVYAAAAIEEDPSISQVFMQVLCPLLDRRRAGAEGPGAVELSVYWQAHQCRYLVCLANFQAVQPNIPVSGMRVWVDTGTARTAAVRQLPSGREIAHTQQGSRITFAAPTFEVLAMFAVELVG